MKVSHVYYNPEENKFEYSDKLVDFDSVGSVDYNHCMKMYFHATRDIDRSDYYAEMKYAEEVCNNYNHMLKVYPYVLTEDSVVICKECKLPFLLTAREKDWYNAKQLSMPCRCEPCRHRRKQSRES